MSKACPPIVTETAGVESQGTKQIVNEASHTEKLKENHTGPGAVSVVLRARDRAVRVLYRLRVPDDERRARVEDGDGRPRPWEA